MDFFGVIIGEKFSLLLILNFILWYSMMVFKWKVEDDLCNMFLKVLCIEIIVDGLLWFNISLLKLVFWLIDKFIIVFGSIYFGLLWLLVKLMIVLVIRLSIVVINGICLGVFFNGSKFLLLWFVVNWLLLLDLGFLKKWLFVEIMVRVCEN